MPGSFPIDTIRMKFPNIELKEVIFEEPVGVNVSRENLGKALLAKVSQKTGEIWLDTECTSVVSAKDSCTVRFRKENITGTLSCKIIIDASGTNPASQRTSIVRQRPPNDQLGYAVQYQMKCVDTLQAANDFYYGSEFSPRGYAWNFPRKRPPPASNSTVTEDSLPGPCAWIPASRSRWIWPTPSTSPRTGKSKYANDFPPLSV